MSDTELDSREQQAIKFAQARNRLSVSAEVFGAHNNPDLFVAPVHPKTPEQAERIKNSVLKCFLFSSVDPKDVDVLVGAFESNDVSAGTVVIQQGDYGDKLYLVEDGTAEFSKKSVRVKCRFFHCIQAVDGGVQKLGEIGQGGCFGELALMYNAPRACSVVALTDMKLWSLDRSTFNHIVRTAVINKREKYDKLLHSVALLSKLDPYDRCRLADALTEKTFVDEDIIVEGDNGTSLFMIMEGNAEAYCQGKLVKTYAEGTVMRTVLSTHPQTPRASTVKAKGKCVVVELERDSCVNLLGPMEERMRNNLKEYQRVLASLNIQNKNLESLRERPGLLLQALLALLLLELGEVHFGLRLGLGVRRLLRRLVGVGLSVGLREHSVLPVLAADVVVDVVEEVLHVERFRRAVQNLLRARGRAGLADVVRVEADGAADLQQPLVEDALRLTLRGLLRLRGGGRLRVRQLLLGRDELLDVVRLLQQHGEDGQLQQHQDGVELVGDAPLQRGEPREDAPLVEGEDHHQLQRDALGEAVGLLEPGVLLRRHVEEPKRVQRQVHAGVDDHPVEDGHDQQLLDAHETEHHRQQRQDRPDERVLHRAHAAPLDEPDVERDVVVQRPRLDAPQGPDVPQHRRVARDDLSALALSSAVLHHQAEERVDQQALPDVPQHLEDVAHPRQQVKHEGEPAIYGHEDEDPHDVQLQAVVVVVDQVLEQHVRRHGQAHQQRGPHQRQAVVRVDEAIQRHPCDGSVLICRFVTPTLRHTLVLIPHTLCAIGGDV
ncbi:cAMP-dependent protein kinase regulatory subunit [Babesia caballi]|uniref:cAMP-dependent protein kinase regulatory subunit n=1 Tax=Babesia caballi TaxID=5871 RepID=A0AAV4LTK3_BABCB|nr:cAMP-dependent protein kinase regulatory subunit [Babesia caballi]